MGTAISFAQQKGGAGKTTLLIHLARAWQLAGKSVALIDLDPQRSLTFWNSLRTDDAFYCLEGAGWRAGSDIRDTAKSYDYTLIDCPGNASDLLEAAVRESAIVLVPCQPSPLDIWASKAILKMAESEKTPAKVVLNRVPARGQQVADAITSLKEAKAQVLSAKLGNRVAFSTKVAQGQTAFEGPGKTKAKAEITAIRKEVERNLKKL